MRRWSTPAFFIRRGKQFHTMDSERDRLRRRIRAHISRRAAEASETDNIPAITAMPRCEMVQRVTDNQADMEWIVTLDCTGALKEEQEASEPQDMVMEATDEAVTADNQPLSGCEELTPEEQDEWDTLSEELAQRWSTAAFFERRGRLRKAALTPDEIIASEVHAFAQSALTEDERAEWDKFSEEFPDGGPDDIDALDPGDYSPLPTPKNPLRGIKKSRVAETGEHVAALPAWGGRGKQNQEYSQVLLEHALALAHQRKEQYRAVPTQKDQMHGYLDSIKREVEVRVQIMRAQVYEIGELLCRAKEALPHGEFLPWLAKAFGNTLSRTSALNAMRVYKACAGQPELLEGYTQRQLNVLVAPAFPKELREMIFSEKATLPKDVKEIAKLGQKYKDSPLPLKEPEITALFEAKSYRIAYKYLNTELTKLWKVIDSTIATLKKVSQTQSPEAYVEINGEGQRAYKDVIELLERFTLKIERTVLDLDEKPSIKEAA